MEHIQLKGTDLKVSPVCLGTWQFNDGVTNIQWPVQTAQVRFFFSNLTKFKHSFSYMCTIVKPQYNCPFDIEHTPV